MDMTVFRSGLFFGLMGFATLAGAAETSTDLFSLFTRAAERSQVLQKIQAQAERLGFSTGAFSSRSFEIKQIQETVGMRTVKTELRIAGIPVVGSGIHYHVTSNGIESYSESIPSAAPITLNPAIDEREAIAIASLRSSNPLSGRPELKLLPSVDRSRVDLVWWVDFRSTGAVNPGAEIVIDATTGRVIGEISKLHTARSETEVYNAREGGLVLELIMNEGVKLSVAQAMNLKLGDSKVTGCYITDTSTGVKKKLQVDLCVATIRRQNDVGAKACQVVNAEDGSFYAVTPENCELYSRDGKIVGARDQSAEQATENAIDVYNYYSDRFGRRSFDGLGSTLVSVVKVGRGWDNAAWLSDLNFMVYGFGDGKEMGDFTQLIDVAGHEMTHGVVSATAKLTMMDEPGALNEATADYFGLQISRYNDWVIGKGLYIQHPQDGLRSLWKPSMYDDVYIDENGERVKKPNPEKYSERYQTTAQCGPRNDRCFVHMNSTVMSHGYYWIHRALGKSKTQDLIFLALTQYYRPQTNFHEAGQLLRQACGALTKQGRLQGDDCARVDDALRRVEL